MLASIGRHFGFTRPGSLGIIAPNLSSGENASMTTSTNPAGQPITLDKATGKLHVPATPIIPFIEGDGTGPDIWRASVRVLDAAVECCYGGQRKI